MPVPANDILCRFLDPAKWFHDDDRPAASAFRASKRKLSMWHRDRIVTNGSVLKDLCIDSLDGFGEGLLKTEDILDAATHCLSPVFTPNAVWSPDDVEPLWGAWRNAHANIESERGPVNFPDDFRLLLAQTCEVSRRPDGI